MAWPWRDESFHWQPEAALNMISVQNRDRTYSLLLGDRAGFSKRESLELLLPGGRPRRGKPELNCSSAAIAAFTRLNSSLRLSKIRVTFIQIAGYPLVSGRIDRKLSMRLARFYWALCCVAS